MIEMLSHLEVVLLYEQEHIVEYMHYTHLIDARIHRSWNYTCISRVEI